MGWHGNGLSDGVVPSGSSQHEVPSPCRQRFACLHRCCPGCACDHGGFGRFQLRLSHCGQHQPVGPEWWYGLGGCLGRRICGHRGRWRHAGGRQQQQPGDPPARHVDLARRSRRLPVHVGGRRDRPERLPGPVVRQLQWSEHRHEGQLRHEQWLHQRLVRAHQWLIRRLQHRSELGRHRASGGPARKNRHLQRVQPLFAVGRSHRR